MAFVQASYSDADKEANADVSGGPQSRRLETEDGIGQR
jgi:hypothetical protein